MSTSATPDLEGFEEFVTRMMAEFSPEVRLAGLAPEVRLAGLTEAEQALALPAAMLRLLPESYIATLPDDVQSKVRARRGS